MQWLSLALSLSLSLSLFLSFSLSLSVSLNLLESKGFWEKIYLFEHDKDIDRKMDGWIEIDRDR